MVFFLKVPKLYILNVFNIKVWKCPLFSHFLSGGRQGFVLSRGRCLIFWIIFLAQTTSKSIMRHPTFPVFVSWKHPETFAFRLLQKTPAPSRPLQYAFSLLLLSLPHLIQYQNPIPSLFVPGFYLAFPKHSSYSSSLQKHQVRLALWFNQLT